MRKYLVSFFLLLCFYSAEGTTYYVASNGNDANSPLQASNPATPWQTINKINSFSFKQGDEILFKRGDVFQGQVNINENGLSYGAFGTGTNPIISGAVLISGWKKYKGNIYVAKVSGTVKNLFVDGKQMTIARYPNTGFLYSGKGNGKVGFTDDQLDQKPGYWIEANVRIDVYEWLNETRVITEFANSYIGFKKALHYDLDPGRAYYIDNKLSILDTENEWFYDSVSHNVYLYPPGGSNPGNLVIQGSTFDYGLVGKNISGIQIKNLRIEEQGIDGIHIEGKCKNIHIVNNEILNAMLMAINVSGEMISVSNNDISHANSEGIYLNGIKKSVISGNIIREIGTVVAYGGAGYFDGTGICILNGSDNNIIDHNYVDSLGYCGILLYGAKNIVQKNIVRYPLLSLADGGGIYSWGLFSHDNIIKDNFVFYPQGFSNGKPGGVARGIYLDDFVTNTIVFHNTVVESKDNGIFFHNDDNNTASDNTIYGCAHSQFYIQDGRFDSLSSSRHKVYKNVFFQLSKNSVGLSIYSKFNKYSGYIDTNYYYNPLSAIALSTELASQNLVMTLPQWQSQTGKDIHSKMEIVPDAVSIGQGPQIFTNPTDNEAKIDLKGQSYKDLDGHNVSGKITIGPWSSEILISNH